MNLLTDPLPTTVSIDGRAWAIHTSFTVGVRFELLMQDETLTQQARMQQALALYYPALPDNLPAAMEQLLWFYRCGKDAPATGSAPHGHATGGRAARAYCFRQDAQLFLAAFWSCYRIDLTEADDLHWWKFRALLAGLPADCRLVEVMGHRTADTTGLPKKQKAHCERMRRLYALDGQPDGVAALTLAERDGRMKQYVAARFAAADGDA